MAPQEDSRMGGRVGQVMSGMGVLSALAVPCHSLTSHQQGHTCVCWFDFLRGYELLEGGSGV